MSGHNKWSSIKHQKGVTDAKRGQLFTKLTKEIMVAVKQGGSNMETNHRLALAVQKAKDGSMPWENIDRALQKGAGTLDGASLNEITIEGFGPGGVAVLVQALSDNRNRTIQDIRSTFTRHGGTMGAAGSVAWLFDPKGMLNIETADRDSDELALQVIEAGADDVEISDGSMDVYTRPEDLEKVRQALLKNNIPISSAELSMIPKTTIELEEKAALQTMKLLDKLEELDDVQHVYSNFDFSDEIMDKYKSAV
ncbi:MAG: YebC/PmpR family DNA-binding transcriptional regulator [Chloroflexota bacterium]